MTRGQQKAFIRDLSRTIVRDLVEKIDAGKIPDSWDGHELRSLLAHRHRQSAKMTILHREPRGRRARAFKNRLAITDL